MKKLITYIQVAFIALAITSCSDNYLDVNTDPNNPTSVSPDLVLPTAQVYTARYMYRGRLTNTLGNLFMVNWSQSDGFSWYYDEFNYLVSSNFYEGIWDLTYVQTLKQYNVLAQLPDDQANYKAIGEIMKAHHFQILVDTYGDIPYFEALQRGAVPTPAYDDAQLVYEDLIVKLTDAIATIKASTALATPGDDDVMFGGDMNEWIRFANTVKLRILIRQSEMAGRAGYIQQEMNVINSEGSGFITTDASVNPGYVNEEGQQSPFYESFGLTVSGAKQNNDDATCISEHALNWFQSTNDPRLGRIYQDDGTGFLGVVQGLLNYPPDDSLEPEFVSNLGPGVVKGADMDAPVILAAESYLLQAEAVQRGFMMGDAKALYESGISASFDYLGASGASSYYAQPLNNVGWDASSDKIEAIITQKWVALNSVNGFESWIEYNRTGFPSGLPVPLNNTRPDRPKRLSYPSSEVVGNSANVPAQPDEFTQGIFWAN